MAERLRVVTAALILMLASTWAQAEGVCRAEKMCSQLEESSAACRLNGACSAFVLQLEELLPVGSCRRPYDREPVPSIWLCGGITSNGFSRLETYYTLLESLRNDAADRVFASEEFRGTLDGHLAETFMERSLAAAKALGGD